ncbi:putative phage tail sheath protein [Salmonella phage SPFM1]|nr:putative phage tail sheath protein [Salmonella phage SPFM1]
MAIKDRLILPDQGLDLIAEGGVLLTQFNTTIKVFVTPKAYFTADDKSNGYSVTPKMIENKIIERLEGRLDNVAVSDRVWADMSGEAAMTDDEREDRSVLNNALFNFMMTYVYRAARSYDYYRLFIPAIQSIYSVSMPWKGNEVYASDWDVSLITKPAYRFSRGELTIIEDLTDPMNYSLANFFSKYLGAGDGRGGMVTGQSAFIKNSSYKKPVPLIELITAVPESAYYGTPAAPTHVYSQGRNDEQTEESAKIDTKAALVNFIGRSRNTFLTLGYDNELKYSLGCFWDSGFSFDVYDELVRREMLLFPDGGKVLFSASNIHYLQGGSDGTMNNVLGQPYDGLQVNPATETGKVAITTDAPADPYMVDIFGGYDFEQFYLYRENLETVLGLAQAVADAYRQTMPDIGELPDYGPCFKPDAYYQPMRTQLDFEVVAGVTSPVVWKTLTGMSSINFTSYQNEVGGRVYTLQWFETLVNGFGFKLIPLSEKSSPALTCTKSKLYPLFDIAGPYAGADETTPAIGAGVVIEGTMTGEGAKINEQVDGLVIVFRSVVIDEVPSYERDSNGIVQYDNSGKLIPEDAKTASVRVFADVLETINTPYQAMFNANANECMYQRYNALSLLGRNVFDLRGPYATSLIFTFAARGVDNEAFPLTGGQDNSVPELVRTPTGDAIHKRRRSMTFIPRNGAPLNNKQGFFECHEYDP